MLVVLVMPKKYVEKPQGSGFELQVRCHVEAESNTAEINAAAMAATQAKCAKAKGSAATAGLQPSVEVQMTFANLC